MQLASSPRRALGLLAAGTIGLSTALLGVTGVAAADPAAEVAAPEVAAALSAPNSPSDLYVWEVGDGSVTLLFDFWPDPSTEAPTGFEVSIDGGTFIPLPVTQPYNDQTHEAVVTGLTNKTEYTFVVHATSAAGDGADSDPVTGTPAKPIGAPTNVTVTTSPGKVTATWAAPAEAGSYDLAKYKVSLFQENMGGPLCEPTPADVFTCTGDAAFGAEYQVDVSAIDTAGNEGLRSAPVKTGVIPFPATVPTSNGELKPADGSSSTVVAGKTMTVTGEGYAPGSTVTVLIYSSPQILTTTVADANGKFSVTVTVPAGLAPGKHTLVASGYDLNGDLRFTTLPVTVTDGKARLADTGADVTVPAIGGIAVLGLGAGLIVLSRRRRTAA